MTPTKEIIEEIKEKAFVKVEGENHLDLSALRKILDKAFNLSQREEFRKMVEKEECCCGGIMEGSDRCIKSNILKELE